MNDAGSVSVIAAATTVVVVVAGLALGALAQVQHAAWRAQTAADAAALAAAAATFPPVGAGPPTIEAADLAAANGARLVDCQCPVDASFAVRVVDVAVTIEVDVLGIGPATVLRSARAEFSPVAALGW